MSADAAPAPLSKVDSAVQGLSSSPPKEKRRASSSVPGVYNILDLGKLFLFFILQSERLGRAISSLAHLYPLLDRVSYIKLP